jgi:hypothetical protein
MSIAKSGTSNVTLVYRLGVDRRQYVGCLDPQFSSPRANAWEAPKHTVMYSTLPRLGFANPSILKIGLTAQTLRPWPSRAADPSPSAEHGWPTGSRTTHICTSDLCRCGLRGANQETEECDSRSRTYSRDILSDGRRRDRHPCGPGHHATSFPWK